MPLKLIRMADQPLADFSLARLLKAFHNRSHASCLPYPLHRRAEAQILQL